MPNILDAIQVSGASYDLKDKNAPSVSSLTQSEYDNLPSTAKTSNTFFVITDATPVDVSQYWTSAQTQSAINQATSGKVNTSSIVSSVTSASTDSQIPTAKAVYDAIPTGGTGGGKAISAGTNISVTTGETADTINCTLSGGTLINISNSKINCTAPIRNGTGIYSIIVGSAISTNKATGSNSIANGGNANTASGQYSYAEGFSTQATKHSSHSEGWFTIASGNYSHTEGNHTKTTNESEHASGKYNASSSASTTFGDSGNTLFSVGNGTADNARHNAFEIRQNGDIYLNDGSKLQDTVSATTANTTALGGLSLVKLTQAQYDALATKDSNVLYVIVG